jgi:glycerate dehydrogenase
MNIVVLDGYTLNPGDISWAGLEALGNVKIYDYTKKNETIERAAHAEILLTNKTILGEYELEKLPNLKYIGVLATGYNVVDIEAATKKGVVITNIPAYGTASVAQMTFALILELTNHVQRHSDSVFGGKWSQSRDFCYWDYPLIELAGKTMGIIGFGRIGQSVADIASVFQMNILAYGANRTDQSNRERFQWSGFDDLLRGSDFVSLHCPMRPEPAGLINSSVLEKMKKTAFLINTARGPLIVEEDLAKALNSETIAGAALDVLSVEPPANSNPLLSAKNCIITPHISWGSKEARLRLVQTAIDNLTAFLSGNIVNAINI